MSNRIARDIYSQDTQTNAPARIGITFTQLLSLAFIVLKLCGVINWSWLWVLSPLWIDLALSLLIIIIAVIIAGLKEIF